MDEQNRLTGAMLLNLKLHGAEIDSMPIGFEGDIDERGTWISFTVWESEASAQRGGERANATPLLPGQDPNKIPSPATVQTFPVVAYA